jgi:ubiquinol-cytochrome c reductase subunit 9
VVGRHSFVPEPKNEAKTPSRHTPSWPPSWLPNMSLSKLLYNVVFRRTSTTAITVLGGAFVFERLFDPSLDSIFYGLNKGVSMRETFFFFGVHLLADVLSF